MTYPLHSINVVGKRNYRKQENSLLMLDINRSEANKNKSKCNLRHQEDSKKRKTMLLN